MGHTSYQEYIMTNQDLTIDVFNVPEMFCYHNFVAQGSMSISRVHCNQLRHNCFIGMSLMFAFKKSIMYSCLF